MANISSGGRKLGVEGGLRRMKFSAKSEAVGELSPLLPTPERTHPGLAPILPRLD